MKTSYLILLIPLSLLIICCVNSEEYQQVKEEFKDVEYNGDVKSFDSIYSQIPDYNEISLTINKLHTKFEANELLDPLGANKYFNSKESSVALGMYIADLGYVRHFERVQLCTEYLEAVQTLAGKLAIGEKEFNETIPLIESNLGNKEVLFGVVDSLLNAGNVLLAGNEKYGISALFLGGFWIETTFVGLSSQDNIDSEYIQEILKSHFEILSQINKLFACLDDKSQLNELKESLIKLEQNGPESASLQKDITKIRESYLK